MEIATNKDQRVGGLPGTRAYAIGARRIVCWLLLAMLLLLPVLPTPEFWITLGNFAGLYSIVAIGLVLLTGVGGMTSFGQAAFVGLGLVMFGAEGSRTASFSEAFFELGTINVSGQSLWVVGVAGLLIAALYFYFERTLPGKALRATAVNRLGARLVGIGTTQAGRLSFTLAAAMGALCGILIAPLTTVYYESGFLVGLKGFVGAIVGGLVSYPVAALGALLGGLLESYSSFWASAFKEVIVFTLIIPVLLWRSLTSKHVEEEE
jgi:ABC-type branched-subunit amino acid transport system permease subunit